MAKVNQLKQLEGNINDERIEIISDTISNKGKKPYSVENPYPTKEVAEAAKAYEDATGKTAIKERQAAKKERMAGFNEKDKQRAKQAKARHAYEKALLANQLAKEEALKDDSKIRRLR